MVLEQSDGDVGVGQQLYVVIKLARRNCACAFLFHLGVTRCAQAQVEVRRCQRQLVSRSLKKIVGEDGNRGLALHHALSGCQFAKKLKFADRNFHGR